MIERGDYVGFDGSAYDESNVQDWKPNVYIKGSG
jgi:hypothetical protein